MTQGRATYTMQFDQAEEVPTNIAERVIEARTGELSRQDARFSFTSDKDEELDQSGKGEVRAR